MTPLSRSPEGKFIDSGAVMFHWLPVLLSAYCYSEPVVHMLERAAVWCRKEAGSILADGGGLLASDPSDQTWLPSYHVCRYQKFIDTAAILRDCAAKVREVWK